MKRTMRSTLWWWWSMRKRDSLAKKAHRKFTGNLAVPNFGVRSAGLRVAARKTDRTSGILAFRATLAYIYTKGLEILEIRGILGNN